MIISASRRTDIPAFYSKWLIQRIKEGYLLSVNPMNRKQVSKISLDPSLVDCIVFWTKNPAPLIKNLTHLKNYQYYFQYTITPYTSLIEKNVPTVEQSISTFKRLAEIIGSEKIIWRYDPIFISDKFDISFHSTKFNQIAAQLKGYTNKCIISFIDLYKKCERNMSGIQFSAPNKEQILMIASMISNIAKSNNIIVETCAEEIDLSIFEINHGKCIDDILISKILGCDESIEKDRNQREECGCVSSIDIGTYNSCPHHCLYCYANYKIEEAKLNYKKHDYMSEILNGKLVGDEKITERKVKKIFKTKNTPKQLNLF